MTWIRCAGTRSQCSESPGQGHRGVPNHSAKGSGPLYLCRMSLFPWPTAQWEQGTGSPAGMEGCCGSEVGPGGKMMLLLSRHILWGRLDPEAKARAQPSGLWVQWVLGPVRGEETGGRHVRDLCFPSSLLMCSTSSLVSRLEICHASLPAQGAHVCTLQSAALRGPFSSTGGAFGSCTAAAKGEKDSKLRWQWGGLCFLFSSFCWRDSFCSWWGATVPGLQRRSEVVN